MSRKKFVNAHLEFVIAWVEGDKGWKGFWNKIRRKTDVPRPWLISQSENPCQTPFRTPLFTLGIVAPF